MTAVGGRRDTPHLFSGFIAVALAAAVLFIGQIIAIHLEHTTVTATAPALFPLKNQGVAFQRVAARAPNVLPFYGTSELLIPAIPEKGDNFFRTAPTGFQVSPVGGGGANLLIMLQRISALGADLHGKKLVISLSPGWFLKPKSGWQGYEGNFSPVAASRMIFGTALDYRLKRDIASRMLECPSTLEGRPLLRFALRCLASDRWLDRVIFCALWPAGKLQTSVLELQDHAAALNYIRHRIKPAPGRHSEVIDWPKLIGKAGQIKPIDAGNVKSVANFDAQIISGSRDVTFRRNMSVSPGWKDLELLLRALTHVQARALILSMPIAGDFYDDEGISRSAREDYYTKLRALVKRYHFPLLEFEAHDEDPGFLIRHQSHLTAKGWIYYDRALDDFFHGRMPRG